jgi:hypothetical protein
MKAKDDVWYDSQIQDIKKRKRATCKSISDSSYGTSFMGGRLTNKKIKEIKEGLTKEKRAAKRASKQFWDKQIEEEIQNFENQK